MKLKRLTPYVPEWSALLDVGAGEFLGEKDGAEFWAICAPDPIGVLGFETLPGGVCECHLWVCEEKRGRWWTRSFYAMLLGIGFSRSNTIVAGVEDDSPSCKIVKRLGWKMYCQQGGLSYYMLSKERLHG